MCVFDVNEHVNSCNFCEIENNVVLTSSFLAQPTLLNYFWPPVFGQMDVWLYVVASLLIVDRSAEKTFFKHFAKYYKTFFKLRLHL